MYKMPTITSLIVLTAIGAACSAESSELSDLRQQVDLQQQQLEEVSRRLGERGQMAEGAAAVVAPEWPDSVSVKGDVRVQYEVARTDAVTRKNRLRGRARFGVFADANEQVRAGIRIATGSDESPTSTNQDLSKFSNKKKVWLDLAYMVYAPHYLSGTDLTLGKMRQPWFQVSDLMYDKDLNPEGASLGFEKRSGNTTLIANAGYFLFQEKVSSNPAEDITMGTGQLAVEVILTEQLRLAVGGTAFVYHNIEGAEMPTDEDGDYLPKGNTSVDVDGTKYWATGFEVLECFAKLDIKNEVAPVKLYAEYSCNRSAEDLNTAWLAGVAAGYGDFRLDYNYRDIESDAIVGLLADASFGGTGKRGHKLKMKYKLLKNWSVAVSLFSKTPNSGSNEELVQVDLIATF